MIFNRMSRFAFGVEIIPFIRPAESYIIILRCSAIYKGGDMRKSLRYVIAWMLILLTVMACTFSIGGGDKEDEAASIETAIAGTLTAEGR